MSDDYAEKLRSLGFLRKAGTTKSTVVRRDDDGTPAGEQVDHWDGRQSATVFARPTTVSTSTYATDKES